MAGLAPATAYNDTCIHAGDAYEQTITCSNATYYTNRSLGFKEEKSLLEGSCLDSSRLMLSAPWLLSLDISSTVAAVSSRLSQ